MPTFKNQVEADQLDALIEYIKTLRPPEKVVKGIKR
jgi:mono/diheme cytochrome c family protein